MSEKLVSCFLWILFFEWEVSVMFICFFLINWFLIRWMWPLEYLNFYSQSAKWSLLHNIEMSIFNLSTDSTTWLHNIEISIFNPKNRFKPRPHSSFYMIASLPCFLNKISIGRFHCFCLQGGATKLMFMLTLIGIPMRAWLGQI